MSAPRSAVLKLIIEDETFRLNREGWSFAEIAAWLNQQLEDSFGMLGLSPNCCRRALKRAMTRLDKVDSQESGRMDWERCEAVYKAVARRAMRGEIDAARVALGALRVKAEIKAAYFAPMSSEWQDTQLGHAEGEAKKASIELTRMRAQIYELNSGRANRSTENPNGDEEEWQEGWEEFRCDHRLLEAHKVTSKELEWLQSTAFLGQLKEKRDFLFLLQQLRAGFKKHE